MKISDAFKGYVYQRKCAFLYVLRELVKENGLLSLRMEHEHGDDFDLIYDTVWRIHQTKDTASPATAVCLKTMWRKYTENIQPHASQKIELQLIFSKDHSTDAGFKAIKDRDHANSALTDAQQRLATDSDVQEPPTVAAWCSFLTLLTLAVLETPSLEAEISERCRERFAYFKPSEENLATFVNSIMGMLDKIMTEDKEVPAREIEEVLDKWCDEHILQLPVVRKKLAELHRAQADQLWPAEKVAISGTGTI